MYFTLLQNQWQLITVDIGRAHWGKHDKISEQRKTYSPFSPQFALVFPSIPISVCREKMKRA